MQEMSHKHSLVVRPTFQGMNRVDELWVGGYRDRVVKKIVKMMVMAPLA